MPFTNTDEDLQFEAEHSWNYEVGLKTALCRTGFRRKLPCFTLTGQSAIINRCRSGRGSMLKNAGESVK